jgi:hypothetical protein
MSISETDRDDEILSNLGFAEDGPEKVENGRYQPRRIRGSFRGRELG